MRTLFLFGSVALTTAAASDVAPVVAPSFRVGDAWMFDQTIERGSHGFDQRRLDMTVERAGGDTILVGLKRDGAPDAAENHLVGADWSIRRIVNGRDMPTARPFTFPMTPGQTWTVDYTDDTRRGAQTSVHVHRTYKVVGWEDVAVQAGTYRAIRVEASGVDQGTIIVPNVVTGSAASSPDGAAAVSHSQRGGTKTVTIREQDELYYAPSVRNYVKSVEEQYNTDDVLVRRQTRTLVSFKPGA